jgi:hypothetical protein
MPIYKIAVTHTHRNRHVIMNSPTDSPLDAPIEKRPEGEEMNIVVQYITETERRRQYTTSRI